MAIRNLNLVLNTRTATIVATQGTDAGAKVLGLRMPEALSPQGRPMSPGFERFEAYPTVTAVVVRTVRRIAKRNATAALNLPGKSVRSRDWALPITWATTTGSGIRYATGFFSATILSNLAFPLSGAKVGSIRSHAGVR